jgi:hypothetical protein
VGKIIAGAGWGGGLNLYEHDPKTKRCPTLKIREIGIAKWPFINNLQALKMSIYGPQNDENAGN